MLMVLFKNSSSVFWGTVAQKKVARRYMEMYTHIEEENDIDSRLNIVGLWSIW
jgi:hypothetical protein